MRLEDGLQYPFHRALYEARCRECLTSLEFSCDFDVDGTVYAAFCCGLRYMLRPSTYEAEITPRHAID